MEWKEQRKNLAQWLEDHPGSILDVLDAAFLAGIETSAPNKI